MVGWHHWLNGHEFDQTLGDSEGEGSLACCNSWDCRDRHALVTEHQQIFWVADQNRDKCYLWNNGHDD